MKFIIGNWKMNGNRAQKESMLNALKNIQTNNKIIMCLPFTLLGGENYGIAIGAQDVSQHTDGAFTGEISAEMLKETGAKYVIVGHSERRIYHNETNEIVRAKACAAINAGLVPIICVGETATERNANKTESVLKQMVVESVPDSGDFMIAYEPCWAIGSGKTPSESEIEIAHKIISETLPQVRPILYGGSVQADNAKRIASIKNVDGLLVGGASLKVDTFLPIINTVE